MLSASASATTIATPNTSDISGPALLDSWGIPGPVFLAIYIVLAAISLVLVMLYRRGTFRAPTDRDRRPLTPVEMGLLSSDRQAVLAAVSMLRGSGLIDSSGHPTRPLTVVDRAALDGFTQAVFDRLATPPGTRPDTLTIPLRELRAPLAERGYLHSSDTSGAVCLMPVITLGVLRLWVGANNHKAIGFLLIIVIVLFVVTMVLRSLPARRTARGDAYLASSRDEYAYLHPHLRPALGSYGASAAAMATGLFGLGALALIDPILATGTESLTGIATTLTYRSVITSSGSGAVFGGSDGGGSGGDGGGSGGGGDGGGGGGGGCGGCGG